MKMRPTKYDGTVLKQTIEYTENYEKHGHMIPTAEGLAQVLNVTKKTIHNWADKKGNEDFLYALGMLKDKQHLELINKGLTGKFNAAIVKLMLVNNHGYMVKKSIEGTHTHEVNNVGKKPTRQELIAIINGTDSTVRRVA